MAEKPAIDARVLAELIMRVNDATRRLRLLEQRVDKLNDSFSRMEESAVVQMKNLEISLERLSNKIALVNDKIKGLEDEILKVNRELAKTAKKAELKQLEGFIDLINPITSRFVTKNEMENYVEEKLKKKA
jgi:chromosome segregation ATPase